MGTAGPSKSELLVKFQSNILSTPTENKIKKQAHNANTAEMKKVINEITVADLPESGDFKEITLPQSDPGATPEKIILLNQKGQIHAFYASTLLGEGATGKVYKAYDLRNGTEVALKVGKLRVEIAEEVESRNREINATTKVKREGDHFLFSEPNLKGPPQAPTLMVIPFAVGVSGESLLYKKKEPGEDPDLPPTRKPDLSEFDQMMISISLLEKVQNLHHKGVIHRDLKLENMMIRGTDVQLFDYDTSIIVDKPLLSDPVEHFKDPPAGTPLYQPPEAGKSSGVYTDTYATGIILAQLATPGFNQKEVTHSLGEGIDPKTKAPLKEKLFPYEVWEKTVGNLRSAFSENSGKMLSEASKNYVLKMMDPKPDQRPPTIKVLLSYKASLVAHLDKNPQLIQDIKNRYLAQHPEIEPSSLQLDVRNNIQLSMHLDQLKDFYYNNKTYIDQNPKLKEHFDYIVRYSSELKIMEPFDEKIMRPMRAHIDGLEKELMQPSPKENKGLREKLLDKITTKEKEKGPEIKAESLIKLKSLVMGANADIKRATVKSAPVELPEFVEHSPMLNSFQRNRDSSPFKTPEKNAPAPEEIARTRDSPPKGRM